MHPLLGLAAALAERGHAVQVIANGYFRDLVQRTGLDYAELMSGEDYLRLARHPDLWNPLRSFRYLFREGIARVMRDQYRMIAQAQRRHADAAVLTSCLGFGGLTAREKLGVRTITVHCQPAVLWSEHLTPVLPGISGRGPRWLRRLQFHVAEGWFLDRVACPELNRFRRELGLPPVQRLARWWNSPDGVLGLFPAWYAPPQPDWPPQVRLAQFPLWDESAVTPPDAAVEAFLAAGDPPLVFTHGSANLLAETFFSAAAEACSRLGRRGVLLTRFAEQLPPRLPAGVIHVDYCPLSRLLPRCAAIVHHGGIGTTAQALRAACPQLIVPMSHDQFDNAARVARLGVGRSLSRRRCQAAPLAAALETLLASEEVQRRRHLVAQRFTGIDPMREACDIVEGFLEAAQGRTLRC